MNNNGGIAVLRIEMKENIPAYILKVIAALIDETYFMHLYLDRATESTDVFSPYYTPTEDEILYINRLEIGTPNFVEFLGQIGPLLETFKWLSELVGAFAGTALAVKQTYEVVKTHWQKKEQKAKAKKIDEELKIARWDNIVKEKRIDPKKSADPYQRALQIKNKLSPEAIKHKEEFVKLAKEEVSLIHKFIYSPTIVVFESEGQDESGMSCSAFAPH